MSRSGTVDAGTLHDCVNHVQEVVNAVFCVNKDRHACCKPDDAWCIINRTKELHRPDIGAGYKAIRLQLKVSLTSSWYCQRARTQNVRSASTTHEPASLFQEHLLLLPLQRFCTRLLQQDHL